MTVVAGVLVAWLGPRRACGFLAGAWSGWDGGHGGVQWSASAALCGPPRRVWSGVMFEYVCVVTVLHGVWALAGVRASRC